MVQWMFEKWNLMWGKQGERYMTGMNGGDLWGGMLGALLERGNPEFDKIFQLYEALVAQRNFC